MGLHLEDARRRQSLTPMVETYTDQGWELFNPVTGEQGVPDNLLLWHRRGQSLLDVTGGHGSPVHFSMIRQSVPDLELVRDECSNSFFALLGVQTLTSVVQIAF